ncbi:MAG: acyltransferase [Betaproteobacteria bacterium HGW-Betaproteobacteria-7]|jgi:peptidoglycan/LPS O-acetylase OafA/YrhL|nr:MAG: acyltransferase [Betaproteobacteria bacterium HGW-Betaproteobacteria-7]
MTKFRTDIQALRGFAVSLVLIYHADFGFLKAGFLGVDVFFVISGFLITGLIKKEIEQGIFSFSEFYFRRAKRLLPAAYATFVLTAVAAPFFLNAQELNDFSAQMLGAVTFTGNVVLLMQSGYFAGAADLKPLLHVWSLSIEEQYYLFLPALLVFLPRRFWKPGLLFLFVGSLGLCLAGLMHKPEWTFYLLPTRAWELGIGSLAAIFPLRSDWAQQVVRVLFWPAIATLVVIPVWPTGLPHPGLDAMAICLATVIVILRNHSSAKELAVVRGMARIGDVSYSLYLAHWPPFAFLKNASVGAIPLQHSFLTLLVGILLGLALYRFVELPTRRLQLHPSRKNIAVGVSASIIVMAIPFVTAQIPVSGPDFAHIRRPNDGFASQCVYESDFEPRKACRDSESPTVLVWGDSYAMHLVSGIAEEWEHGVVQATRGTCGPFLNLAPLSNIYYLQPWAESCLKFNADIVQYIENTKSIRVVVISSPFKQYLKSVDGKHHWLGLRRLEGGYVRQEPSLENVIQAMAETIDKIRSLGREVIIVAPPPAGGFNIGTCTERRVQGKIVYGAPLDDCTIPLDLYKSTYGPTLDFLRLIEDKTGISVVSFDSLLCDQDKCMNVMDKNPIYVDGGHLTHEASVLLMRKIGFGEIISKVINKQN